MVELPGQGGRKKAVVLGLVTSSSRIVKEKEANMGSSEIAPRRYGRLITGLLFFQKRERKTSAVGVGRPRIIYQDDRLKMQGQANLDYGIVSA